MTEDVERPSYCSGTHLDTIYPQFSPMPKPSGGGGGTGGYRAILTFLGGYIQISDDFERV